MIKKTTGKLYLERTELRIKKLEEAVFKNRPFINPATQFKQNSLIARIDRLEAAVSWDKN